MVSRAESNVLKYFKGKAGSYDLVDTQSYWNFSDELLWYLLEKVAFKALGKKKFRFLDAGGGTGRWFIKILERFPHSSGTIYDLSPHMLAEAEKKLKSKGLLGRAGVVNGNIKHMTDQKSGTYDLIICFHNVLGFVDDPKAALKEISRLLRKGGLFVSVVPNKYHGVYFNISEGRLAVAEKIAYKNRGTFHDSMPDMDFFTPDGIKKLYARSGLPDVRTYGFPVALYPTIKETTIKESTKSLKDMLTGKTLVSLRNMEKRLVLNEDAAGRGNNLFVIGRKTVK